MSDSDLRPPGGSPVPPPSSAVPSGARWWEPLASRWGILGLLIFIGLAISVTQSLFTSEPGGDEVDDIQKFQAEVGKLDAAALGKRLLAVLEALPGDNPKKSFDQAHTLAYLYGNKWGEENTAREAKVSEFQRRELQAKRDAVYAAKGFDSAMRQPVPDYQKILAALKESFSDLDGAAIHYVGQKFSARIKEQSEKVADMPALRSEIEDRFRQPKPTTLAARREFQRAILDRAAAYRLADEMRRKFPSAKPDLLYEKRQKEANGRLDSLDSVSFEEAGKVILQTMADADEGTFEASVKTLLQR